MGVIQVTVKENKKNGLIASGFIVLLLVVAFQMYQLFKVQKSFETLSNSVQSYIQ